MNEQENYLYHKRSGEGAVTYHHNSNKKTSNGKAASLSTITPLNTSSQRNPNFLVESGGPTAAYNSANGSKHATSADLMFSYLARTGQPGFDKISTEWTT
ncbi:hypothetical protein PG984_005779 [Apiospora sp. TS-2023a]